MSKIRVEARDIPPDQAARRLGMTLPDFQDALQRLFARGFPAPDPDTGNFDMHAIDRWCDARHSHLFGEASQMQARDASAVAHDRILALRRGTK